MSERIIDEEEQAYLDRRVIDNELRLKLVKKLRKCSEVIDCMGHTPSRQHLEEQIRLIIWGLKSTFDISLNGVDDE
jgi:hypothetical protein